MNMSFDKTTWSNSNKSSWNTLPFFIMFHHFCYYVFFLTFYLSYVASIYVTYLCSIFFQAIRHEKQGPDAVRIIKSRQTECIPEYKIRNTSVSIWPVTFLQSFGRLVGCLMIFARFRLFNTFYLTVIKTYDWFTAIKRLGSSPISFILLHSLSYIFFNFFF
jgi:hypothetical protein